MKATLSEQHTPMRPFTPAMHIIRHALRQLAMRSLRLCLLV